MRVLKWNVFGLAVLLLLLLPPSVVAQEPAPVTRENTVTYEQLLANREAAGEVGTDPQYVIVDLPQQSEVRIANVSYHERYGTMDIYYPPDFDFESSVPAVVFPNYYPDSQYKSGFGVTFRQSRLASDWASLLAASGMAAIVYDTGQPYFSGRAALDFVAAHAGALRIDTGRLGFFAASADVQTAMQLLSKSDIDAVSGVQACVFSYPTTFSGYVPAGSPEVLVVRAGMDRDEFLRNTDNGVERLRDRGHNVTVLEYEEGKHAFDVVQDTERSREVIHEIIAFLKAELER